MKLYHTKIRGLNTCLCATDKFNTTTLCLVYRLPLRRETAGTYALLPKILTRASRVHPSLRAINVYLEEIGGGELIARPIKKGNEQILAFYLTAPSESTGKMFQLLREIVYNPLLRDGGFMPSYVHNACAVAAREIGDRLNNKRAYALERLIETMCSREAFGINPMGYIEDFGDVSGERLYTAYKQVLKQAVKELYAVGNITPVQLESYINNSFDPFPEGSIPLEKEDATPTTTTRYYKEEGDTAQSILAIGIRCRCKDYPGLKLANEILGGGAASRLFKEIREKHSLCYYINSTLYRYKGIIAIEAGIEANMAERVKEAVEKELTNLNKRGVHKHKLTCAKDSLLNSYYTLEDYPQKLADYMLSLSVAGEEYSLHREGDAIAALDTIEGAFEGAYMDTVYLLKEGKG